MHGELIIRRYEEKDLDGIFEMIGKAFTTPILDRVYEDEVKTYWLGEYSKEYIAHCAAENRLYVAELDGKIVASGAVGIYVEEPDKAYISAVFTDPTVQGKGLGSRMMQTLEQDEFTQRFDTVYITAALSAARFYQKLGYTFKFDVPVIILDGILDVVYMEKPVSHAGEKM